MKTTIPINVYLPDLFVTNSAADLEIGMIGTFIDPKLSTRPNYVQSFVVVDTVPDKNMFGAILPRIKCVQKSLKFGQDNCLFAALTENIDNHHYMCNCTVCGRKFEERPFGLYEVKYFRLVPDGYKLTMGLIGR